MLRAWNRTLWTAGWTFAAVVVLAPVALAVDGALEIDQDCVATGCFPGDGPGFPVEIAPAGGRGGSYRLTSDLVVPDDDTTAILGSGEFVTLDLGGFSIQGQYSCTSGSPPTCPGGSARAVDFPAGRAVHLRNGIIHSFGSDGVRLPRSSQVERLTIEVVRGNGIVVGLGSIVRGNVLTGVGEDGIRVVTATGFAVDSLVERNVVRTTGGDGIEADLALILGNLVIFTGDESARLGSSSGFGQNRFDGSPNGGVSMGDNVCGGGPC